MAELESAEHTGLLSDGREISISAADYSQINKEAAAQGDGNGSKETNVHLLAQVNVMIEEEALLMERLLAAEELTKRTRNELKDARLERLRIEAKVRAMDHKAHMMIPRQGPLEWVDSYWFVTLCSLIVILNLGAMVRHDSIPRVYRPVFDNVFLLWYLTELSFKVAHHRSQLFIGPTLAVVWNWLDLGIVVSGVVDQWLCPVLFGVSGGGGVLSMLRCLRLFRFLRFLKLLKQFLVTDMDWIYESQKFDIFIASIIGLNGVIISLQLDYEWEGWIVINNLFLCIYLFELLLRLKRWGKHFFVHHTDWAWNCLDFSIVFAGVLDLWLMPGLQIFEQQILGWDESEPIVSNSVMSLVRLMRVMRVLRLVRVLRSVPPLYTLLVGVIGAFQAMKWVIVLTLLTLYGGAIVFTNLVGKGLMYGEEEPPPEAVEVFGTMGASLFSLFELMNGELSVIKPIKSNMVGQFLFAGFMVISNWAVLAILTAVVSENMISTSGRFAEEEKEKAEKEFSRKSEERLLELFEAGDPSKSGRIGKEQWHEMVNDGATRLELAEGTSLTKDDMTDIFDCLAIDDDDDDDRYVDYRDLIHSLRANTTVADKRSVLHVMIRLRAMQDQLNQDRRKHNDQINSRFDEIKKLVTKQMEIQPAA